jgi:NADH:ubiquinone oxidoreductase subunit H
MLFVFSAEVGRTPVDLVERESELVSGFNTEYAGGVFVGYFLGEYLVLTLFFLT